MTLTTENGVVRVRLSEAELEAIVEGFTLQPEGDDYEAMFDTPDGRTSILFIRAEADV